MKRMTEEHIDRRGFLRRAAATGGVVAAPYVITSAVLGNAERPPASERVVTGYIGTGPRGMVNIREQLCQVLDNAQHLAALGSRSCGIGESVAVVHVSGEVSCLIRAKLGKLANQLLSIFLQRCDGAIDVHDNPSGSTARRPNDRVGARSHKLRTNAEGTPSCISVSSRY